MLDEAAVESAATAAQVWTPVPAGETGDIVSIDNAALLAFAREQRRVVRMEVAIGDFVVQGETLASLEGEGTAARDAGKALNACYSFGRQRTTEQDAGFGLQQIVDVGLKALSLVGVAAAAHRTLAFGDLRESAAGKPTVLKRLHLSIERLAAATGNRHRRAVLAAEVERIADCARRGLPASFEREEVLARAAKLRSALGPAA